MGVVGVALAGRQLLHLVRRAVDDEEPAREGDENAVAIRGELVARDAPRGEAQALAPGAFLGAQLLFLSAEELLRGQHFLDLAGRDVERPEAPHEAPRARAQEEHLTLVRGDVDARGVAQSKAVGGRVLLDEAVFGDDRRGPGLFRHVVRRLVGGARAGRGGAATGGEEEAERRQEDE